ncbi:glycosyltransferase family 1 protein [Clostridium autoethanogenum]|uniref:Glycosyltransferase family 1 protein n=2 Tax=Clostridium autoethanogenum TaxID=84023 RepID=A0A3M0S1L5_9CLOT|nr:glycosyltransferase family 1 protein [Clostridium autoethanogenum]
MVKVLIISTVGLKYEGITSVILANLKSMNLSGLQIYVAGTVEVEPEISKEFKKLRCEVIDFPNRRVNTVSYFFALIHFIRKNKIDVVHAHGNSATLSIELFAAWLGGCKKRIAHSHNTRCAQVKADRLLRPLFNHLYTDALACGYEAGKWLFNDNEFIVINNGRDIDTFHYDSAIRESVRKEYGLEGKTVIGHVGGFVEQKNHCFLIDIFQAIHQINQDTVFFLIGDGPLCSQIEEKVKKYGLEDCVIFTGLTNRVPQLLQAMDGMVLPSFFEGLPLVVIEWQIAALPCVISDTVSRECAITDLVEFCQLTVSPKMWAIKILEKIEKETRSKKSKTIMNEIKAAGFDIKDNADVLRKLYISK